MEYLLDLMNEQSQRKKQLMETINSMSNQDNTENFWLLQYQRLLDSQPMFLNNTSIDPNFGYRLLMNGVIHVVPFLMKIWRTKSQKLYTVTDDELKDAGIRNENDRLSVLQSISEYLNDYSNEEKMMVETLRPTAPEEASNISTDNNNKPNEAVTFCECVVCLDLEAQVLFLPCGKLTIRIPIAQAHPKMMIPLFQDTFVVVLTVTLL